MKLMFAIRKSGGDAVDRVTTTDKEIIAGSDPGAAIQLPGLAASVFTVARMDDGLMVLEKNNTDIKIIVDGDVLTNDSMHIRNGAEIHVGEYTILLTVSFDRAAYSSRNSIAVMLSAVLIVAILLSEAVIVHWLPKQIQTSELWGAEVLRQSTVHALDNLRGQATNALKAESKDPFFKPTLRLYKEELDRLAMYVRENQTRLSVDQLKRLDKDLKLLGKQIRLHTAGKLIPSPRTLDSKRAVETILNEKED